MTPQIDQQLMRRALELARRGRGSVEPNPMVGCVIARDGRIIGEGHHERFGGPHAEPHALAHCTESPRGATAYVTLEPCCHTQKKTPPCVPRLIEAGLGRVVVGCLDPNPQVNGRGVAMLRAAGVAVDEPLIEDECRQLIAAFIKKQRHHRPYVTLKWAQSADGKVAGPGGMRAQISSKQSLRAVHDLRGRFMSIAVGVNTVINDDPMLTSRLARKPRPTVRVVLDSSLRTPLTARVVETAGEVRTVLFHAEDASPAGDATVAELTVRGVEIVALPAGAGGHVAFDAVLDHAGQWEMPEMLVEPGPTLAASLLAGGLVDRLWVFRSSRAVNDPTAPAAAAVPDGFILTGEVELGGDILSEYLNRASPVFFAPTPSADLLMAE